MCVHVLKYILNQHNGMCHFQDSGHVDSVSTIPYSNFQMNIVGLCCGLRVNIVVSYNSAIRIYYVQ